MILTTHRTVSAAAGTVATRMQGHPKDQSSFARVSGYVEQNDIHSPQTTVREALQFSAHLRLPSDTGRATVEDFVDEVACPLQPPLALTGRAPHPFLASDFRSSLEVDLGRRRRPAGGKGGGMSDITFNLGGNLSVSDTL